MSLPARTSPVRLLAAAGAALVAAVVAGCAPADSSSSASGAGTSGSAAASGSASAAACSKDQLATKTKGKLTIATDKPVYEPWFVDDKPENGKGFEGAVAYAVAEQARLRPGRRHLDARRVRQRHPARAEELRLRHQRVLDHRRAQAGGRLLPRLLRRDPGVVTVKGSKIANATSIAELKNAKTRRPGRHDEPRRHQRTRSSPATKPARVQHQRRRREGPRERPDRRARHRPADGVLHTGAAQLKDGKIVGQCRTPRHAGAVRPGARQGQRR